MIKLTVYDNFEDLKSYQAGWDKFVESVGCEVILTYDWCRIWWKYYGTSRNLRIFVFECGNEIVGIVPLFTERIRFALLNVKAAKLVGSDFTLAHFSLPIVSEYLKDAFDKVVEQLVEEDCDIIHIGPIAGLYNDYDKLKEIALKRSDGKIIASFDETKVQTYFPLEENLQAYLEKLSKNARRNIKRKIKGLREVFAGEPGHFEFELANSESFEQIFTEFVQMHQNHWLRLDKLGHFGDWPDSFKYHREMALTQLQLNRLRLAKYRWGPFNLGYEYAYNFGNMYYAFLNARTDSERVVNANVGTNMFIEQVKSAIAEKVRYIDAMRARYEYKLRLGGALYNMKNIFIYRSSLLSSLKIYLFRLAAGVLNILYYKLWFVRIAGKLGLKRGPLWRTWIRTCMFS